MLSAENKILECFGLDLKASYYLRELQRTTKINLSTLSKSIANLQNDRILQSVYRGRTKLFSINIKEVAAVFMLACAEIKRTIEFLDKHPHLKAFVRDIPYNSTVVLFGSLAKGTESKDSDIDLLKIDSEGSKLAMHLLPYEPHIIELSKEQFLQSLKDKEALTVEILKNHVILNRHETFIRMVFDAYGG